MIQSVIQLPFTVVNDLPLPESAEYEDTGGVGSIVGCRYPSWFTSLLRMLLPGGSCNFVAVPDIVLSMS